MADIRLASVEEAPIAMAIWREVSEWLADREMPVWSPDEFDLGTTRQQAAAKELVIGFENSGPAACMLIQTGDPIYWPEKAEGTALYLHKIAVRRAFAGRGWGNRLIAWAVERATKRGLPLRLDCLPRPVLMNFYRNCGFRPVDDGPVTLGGFTVVRHERPPDPD